MPPTDPRWMTREVQARAVGSSRTQMGWVYVNQEGIPWTPMTAQEARDSLRSIDGRLWFGELPVNIINNSVWIDSELLMAQQNRQILDPPANHTERPANNNEGVQNHVAPGREGEEEQDDTWMDEFVDWEGNQGKK